MTHHDPHAHETVHEDPHHVEHVEHIDTVETHHVDPVSHGGGYFTGSPASMMGVVLALVLILLIILVLVWAS